MESNSSGDIRSPEEEGLNRCRIGSWVREVLMVGLGRGYGCLEAPRFHRSNDRPPAASRSTSRHGAGAPRLAARRLLREFKASVARGMGSSSNLGRAGVPRTLTMKIWLVASRMASLTR